MTDDEKNVLLHKAVVVGYIRVCRKAAECVSSLPLKAIADHAEAHLARPEFAGVPSIAKFEIFEFVKDGLLYNARDKIHDALEGRHGIFWRMANRSLLALGYPEVEPVPIADDLLD